ncbi:hypothetical protein BGW37DRAFT_307469 [Umbelopsis sp. PMI_123]|nr:hypothetical protein BGW37DRAFT_307469 [Umbelopsis sp. PMI_123]
MTTQSLTAPLPIPQHRSSRTDKDSSSSHNSLSGSPSSSTSSQSNQSYRELVKQITSQAPKPYGAIPPLIGRHKRKKRKKEDSIAAPPTATDKNIPPSGEQPVKTVATRITGQDKPTSPRKATLPPMRSMSHVENWVAVDSKESLPDEEELVSNVIQGGVWAYWFISSLKLRCFNFLFLLPYLHCIGTKTISFT